MSYGQLKLIASGIISELKIILLKIKIEIKEKHCFTYTFRVPIITFRRMESTIVHVTE